MKRIIMKDQARVMREFDEKREIQAMMKSGLSWFAGFIAIVIVGAVFSNSAHAGTKQRVKNGAKTIKTAVIKRHKVKKDFLVSPQMAEYMVKQGSGLVHREWDVE